MVKKSERAFLGKSLDANTLSHIRGGVGLSSTQTEAIEGWVSWGKEKTYELGGYIRSQANKRKEQISERLRSLGLIWF